MTGIQNVLDGEFEFVPVDLNFIVDEIGDNPTEINQDGVFNFSFFGLIPEFDAVQPTQFASAFAVPQDAQCRPSRLASSSIRFQFPQPCRCC